MAHCLSMRTGYESLNEQFLKWINDLDSTDYEVRIEARQALIDCADDIVDVLIAVMMEERGRQSWEAGIILSERHELRAVPAMIRLLTSKHPTLGQVAAEALGQYGCRFIDELLKALPECTPLTQIAIVKTLGKLGDQCAVTPLINLLITSESSTIIHITIKTLADLCDPSALPAISGFQDHPDHHVRKSAANAIFVLNNRSKNGG